MTHADTLRTWAGQYITPAAREPFLAGADAIEAIGRVRNALTDLRGQQGAALQRWDDTGDTWDGAVSDTLHDTIHLLTEALEGDTE